VTYDCKAEWMAVAEFMAVEGGYRIAPKGKGLLSPAIGLIERDLKTRMAFVIIPEKPTLH
jgi:hypothetical protein